MSFGVVEVAFEALKLSGRNMMRVGGTLLAYGIAIAIIWFLFVASFADPHQHSSQHIPVTIERTGLAFLGVVFSWYLAFCFSLSVAGVVASDALKLELTFDTVLKRSFKKSLPAISFAIIAYFSVGLAVLLSGFFAYVATGVFSGMQEPGTDTMIVAVILLTVFISAIMSFITPLLPVLMAEEVGFGALMRCYRLTKGHLTSIWVGNLLLTTIIAIVSALGYAVVISWFFAVALISPEYIVIAFAVAFIAILSGVWFVSCTGVGYQVAVYVRLRQMEDAAKEQ